MRTAFWFALVLFCLAPCALSAATFTATLDRDQMTLGENASLTFTVENGSPSQIPSAPVINGLNFNYTGFPGQPSGRFTFNDTSKLTYIYRVTPLRTGEFAIPAITINVGSEKLSSQPLKLNVLLPGAPSAEAINSGGQKVFMKIMPPKKEVYAGEAFTTEIDVYVQDGMRVGDFQLTSFVANGLTFGKNTEGKHRHEQVGNAMYEIVPIIFAMNAAKSGDFTIGPATASISEEVVVPFGVFQRMERHQLNLATESVIIKSLPLPTEKVPADFSGAVGKFSLNVTAGPTNVTVGDPVTVRVQISGHGVLDSVLLPDQTGLRDFKIYPPTSKIETTDPLGIEGSRTFEEIVVPQNADVRQLPPVSFSYFDPDAKEYRTVTQPAIQLAVRAGNTSITTTMLASRAATDNTPPTAQDIVPIKQRLGTVRQIKAPLVRQTWFLAAQGVPVLAWVAALVWRKRKESFANNPRLRRQREVARVIQTGLADLQTLARENKPEEFFATLFRLLQERLGERLDLPASAITEAVIDERLRPGGVQETTLEKLQELFQLCNLARYAPVRGSQELAALIPKLKTVLDELNKVNA